MYPLTRQSQRRLSSCPKNAQRLVAAMSIVAFVRSVAKLALNLNTSVSDYGPALAAERVAEQACKITGFALCMGICCFAAAVLSSLPKTYRRLQMSGVKSRRPSARP
jgi:hypothetical protein